MIVSGYSNYSNPYMRGVLNNSMGVLFGQQTGGASSLGGLGGLSNLSSLFGTGQTGGIDYNSASYMQGIKSDAKDLTSAIGALKKSAVSSATTPTSSSSEHMTVSASSTSNFSGEMKVKIDQVASGQVNEGSDLRSGATSGMMGRQQFEVEAGGRRHQFTINVNSTDSNEAVQKKMAQAINDANIGVKAEVSTDSKAGTSALSVQAKGTGDADANRFSIRDVSGSAVSRMGVGEVTQDAQDAVYSVNGQQKTSKTNTVDLGKGLTATLRKADDKELSVSMQRDTQGMQSAVKDLVSSFNDLLKAADKNGGDRLSRELSNISKTYGNTLGKLGVSVDDQGYMKVDEDKLSASAADGSLRNTIRDLSNTSYGLEGRLSRTASNIENNPSYYASNSMRHNSASELFGNYQSYTKNANLSYMLSQQQNIGMLFNWMG